MASPQHPKARLFEAQGLFGGLTNFAELEERIAALPTEQDRGNAFEVFAEAYLATQRKHDATHVWPLNAVPTDVLERLNLGARDYGIDGVFRTTLGSYSAYQVKFFTNRPPLTWRQLATFFGLSDSGEFSMRVLFTNCDELPKVLNQRRNFFCIRGADLDRLAADDFNRITQWLADREPAESRKTPKPYQVEAVTALLGALETENRVSAIMACGTGKTLVGLWTAERIHASTMLVLLPSLALLRQTLHTWLHETRLPKLAYLCVCSDSTVKEGLDSLETNQSDLDFSVTTDASSIRRFLDTRYDGSKVIFSTYQSAKVVAEALKPEELFDFAVFDEAHKTAGKDDRNLAFALSDTNIPIRKRLFFTATPRHYNPRDRDEDGEAKLVLSMDNPEVYGKQAYQLSFSRAASLGIICRYKVLISVITSEQVNNELLDRGEVFVDGESVGARMIANQIAMRDAVDRYGPSHIFTFHRTVADARDFVDDKFRLKNSLTDFRYLHVNGKMPTAARERVMRDFRSADCGILSNARCLTEGVDVPAVDMVAFLSRRRSLVDIVQATGRAMRTSPGKELGYVLVPLFVELKIGESIEEAVSRGNFQEIWDILQSLQEQDDVLADYISRLAVSRSRKRPIDFETPDSIEVMGETVDLDRLLEAVTVRACEKLFESWQVHYGELIEYKEKYGHSRVPMSHKENKPLANWVMSQRNFFAKGKLAQERIAQLEELGFEWDPFAADWERSLDELKAYKTQHGHSRVPMSHKENKPLANWVMSQRNFFAKGQLAKERVVRLEELGFEWDPFTADWENFYEELKTYKAQHGHCKVPKGYKENKTLGRWVMSQRAFYRKNKLAKERVVRLEEIGFEWIGLATGRELRGTRNEAN